MQVEGHVPCNMAMALWAFLDLSHMAWKNVQDTQSLAALKDALEHFYIY